MTSQHQFILVFCLVLLLRIASCEGTKKALIFDRQPHACDGCQYAMAAMLSDCDGEPWETYFLSEVGNDLEEEGFLNGYDLYVQPGGDSPGNGKKAFNNKEMKAIKQWVGDGGRYYGSCWGGYAVGNWVFGFINTGYQPERFLNPDIPYDFLEDMNVTIKWVHETDVETYHVVYFQDGPTWLLNQNQENLVTRLAEYEPTGNIAAMVFDYGAGKVGATGVHFEGSSSNPDEYPGQYELGCLLVAEIMS